VKQWIGGVTALVALFAGSIGLLVATGSQDGNGTADGTGVDVATQAVRVTTTRPTTTTATPAERTPPPLRRPDVPACATGDEPVEGDPTADWATIVVDTGHRLDPSYMPPDLVPVSDAGFRNADDRVRRVVIDDLGAFRLAAEAQGLPFVIVSAYRSAEYQRQLFEGRVLTDGPDIAAAFTARPGHSEHQLGTTIDILDPESGELTTEFGSTETGRWVAQHAHEFGFVLSYPSGARDQTCYDYEPWHLRYVGPDIADRIHRSGMTPREWLLAQAMAAG
jgi:zinc D-Ala-D-Ala carboxypeptidase